MVGTYEDPPEYRDGASGGGGMQISLPSVGPLAKRLMWINGGVFLFFLLVHKFDLGKQLYGTLALDPVLWKAWYPLLPVWQVLTYGFMHAMSDPFHLLFNLLGIYFFGTMVENRVGSRRFLVLTLAAIVLGGVVQLLVGLATEFPPPTVGASGAVLCYIVAAAVMNPNARVIFILFPLRLKTLAMIMVGIDLFGLLQGGGRTAYAVHLVGALYGFLAVRRGWVWRDPVEELGKRREAHQVASREADEKRLDELLARIHREGIHTLSRSEREFMKRVSSRR